MHILVHTLSFQTKRGHLPTFLPISSRNGCSDSLCRQQHSHTLQNTKASREQLTSRTHLTCTYTYSQNGTAAAAAAMLDDEYAF